MKTNKQIRSEKRAEINSGQMTYLPPYESQTTPSSAMLDHIEMLLILLERKGVDISQYRNKGKYKTRYAETKQMIHALHKLSKEYGIDYENCKIIYVNLCRDKKTKKKIKYKTSYRLGHPKGYEYMGTLSQIIEERKENEQVEVRTGNDTEL